MDKQEERLKRSHVYLLKHPKTAGLGGIILMGKSEVIDNHPTAYTDGINKKYGREFMGKCTDEQLNGLVMHENGHVFFRHVTHHKKIFREDAKLANIAADFVVNDMIVQFNEDKIQLPPGALWNEMFRNWSVVQVYNYLKKRKDEVGGNGGNEGKGGNEGESGEPGNSGSPGGEKKDKQTDVDQMLRNLNDYDSLDEHDIEGSELDEKEISEKIDKALREGGLLAGILGGNKNRAIEELLEPVVDWREALAEFVLAICSGKSQYSWKRFNNRQVANDFYLPTVISETVGEIVVAIDTSGSIGGPELSAFASELVSICEMVTPEKVRVLWWDTSVHGEQVFNGNYDGLQHMLKPVGGGGTKVSCVSEYLIKKNINPECVVVFTDGFVEDSIKWNHQSPLLWLITQNKNLNVPTGKKVHVKEV